VPGHFCEVPLPVAEEPDEQARKLALLVRVVQGPGQLQGWHIAPQGARMGHVCGRIDETRPQDGLFEGEDDLLGEHAVHDRRT